MVVQTNSQLFVKTIEKTQNPWNKQIPFLVKVQINSDNIIYMQILPQATAGYFKPKHIILNKVSRGIHIYKFLYVPTEQGVIHYTFSVAASTKQTNLAASDSGVLTLSSHLTRTPISLSYLMYQLGGYIVLLGLVFLILILVKKGLYYLKNKTIPSLINEQIQQGI